MREVEMSELAKMFRCYCVIMPCGCNQSIRSGGESFDGLSKKGYSVSWIPSLLAFKPNAFIPGTVWLHLAVLVVLRISAGAQILIGIVERVVVAMVSAARIIICQAENIAVHPNRTLASIGATNLPHGVETLVVFVPPRKPLELIQFLEAVRGHLRKLSLRKRYQAVFLRWGCHWVAPFSDEMRGCFSTPQPHFTTV